MIETQSIELAERDAAAVVAHAHGALGELDLDLLAEAHRELVDGVVDRLLEQDVDAVLGVVPLPPTGFSAKHQRAVTRTIKHSRANLLTQ